MKYIITESQERIIQILRRATSADWPLIQEMVDEGLDLDDPCDFRDEESYLHRVINDSTKTYLFHYFDKVTDEGYSTLFGYIRKLIYERMGDDIIEYFQEKKEDCEEF